MQHKVPQSLLVFAVPNTPETPNFRTFGGDARPLRIIKKNCLLSVYL